MDPAVEFMYDSMATIDLPAACRRMRQAALRENCGQLVRRPLLRFDGSNDEDDGRGQQKRRGIPNDPEQSSTSLFRDWERSTSSIATTPPTDPQSKPWKASVQSSPARGITRFLA